jgi:hypothetical protein
MKADTWMVRTSMLVLLGLALAACGMDSGDPAAAHRSASDHAAAGGAAGHGMGGMHMASSAMQRHVRDAEAMLAVMRPHLQEMRQLTAAQQHDRMQEHVVLVSRMLGMMEQHMREMGHGMETDHEHMSGAMGMSAEDHRQMMEQMRTLRSQIERLQTASRAEVGQRMPQHLEHLDQMLRHMENGAGHMHHR